jgi:uncharacterized damage-inducible protein DinB
MFTSIDDFVERWTGHANATKKILGALTDDSLGQAVAQDHRTLGRMAWHIVTSIPEMMPLTGLEFHGVKEDAAIPGKAADYLAAYDTASKELLEQVQTKWKDADLMVEDDMYGEKWKRGVSLHLLIEHEIHHRGQMTVLMRQAGLKVPGVFGPAKEEWGQYGMEEPKI